MRNIARIFCFLLILVGFIVCYFLYIGELLQEDIVLRNCYLGFCVLVGIIVFAKLIPEEIRHNSKILHGEKIGKKSFVIFWSIYSFVSNYIMYVLGINFIIFLISIIPMLILDHYVKDINYYWTILIKCIFVISLFIGIWLSYTETRDEIKQIKTQDNTETNNE